MSTPATAEKRKLSFLEEVLGPDLAASIVEIAEDATKELEPKVRYKQMPYGGGGGPTSFAEIDRVERTATLGPQLVGLVSNIVTDAELDVGEMISLLEGAVADFSRLARSEQAAKAKALRTKGFTTSPSPAAAYVAQLVQPTAALAGMKAQERDEPVVLLEDLLTGNVGGSAGRHVGALFARFGRVAS
jgi:hypothetical protein